MKLEDYEQMMRASIYAAFLAQMVAAARMGCELSDNDMKHAIACANQLFATWERVEPGMRRP